MKRSLTGMLGLSVFLGSWFGSVPAAQEQDPDRPPPVAPPYLRLHERDSRVTPRCCGFAHTGGGVIDVTQPAPDIVVITMGGVVTAGAHPFMNSLASFDFDLTQCLEVVMDKPEGKSIKLNVSARVIGLLRSQVVGKGVAEESGCVTLTCGPAPLTSISLPDHAVANGKNLSISDQEGPVPVPVGTGKYTLHQSFHVCAKHPLHLVPCKALSAEFAPDPALNPHWISYFEAFHGIAKNNFGFQVTIQVTAD